MANSLLTPEQQQYFKFVNDWHYNTIKNNKVGRDKESGELVTVNAVGIQLGDKIYTVPGYLPDEGRRLTPREARAYWKDKIPQLEKEGKIVPYVDNWVGSDKSQHPINIMTELNHRFMDSEGQEIPEDAITVELEANNER